MKSLSTRARDAYQFLGRGVTLAYVIAVLPCVLLIMDMVRSMLLGQTIAMHVFLLTIFAPVAITAIYITWYKLRHKE